MGTKAIDPQSIRNVTIIGTPGETTRIAHRFLRGAAGSDSGTPATVRWTTDRADHTIHLAELSSHAPIAELERSVRVADAVIAVVNSAAANTARLETLLRVADDHQVARLCLVTGLDHPAADFDRCLRTITATRGAEPLTLQIPLGTGADFEGVLDLVPMWALEPMGVEFYGPRWQLAEQHYRTLVATVMEQDAGERVPPRQLHTRIRRRTRLGDAAPILCDPAPWSDDITPLMDAIVRYLPSPLEVCQPEHALDY